MSLNCLLLPEKVTFENVMDGALNVIFSNDEKVIFEGLQSGYEKK